MDNERLFQMQDEQYALACLLTWPDENRWELDGLTADLFSHPVHRQIAEAILEVRNSGRRVHWRRVRGVLRKRVQREAWALVRPLTRAVGAPGLLTSTMSRLVYAQANHRRAA